MFTIDRERLISEKQNNKASPKGARLPKEAMLLRDIHPWTRFVQGWLCKFENICIYADLVYFHHSLSKRERGEARSELSFWPDNASDFCLELRVGSPA